MRLLTILSSSRDTLLLPHPERRKVLPVARHFLVFGEPMLLLNNNRALCLFSIGVKAAFRVQ